jgi:uroporphyrinogen-III synthase
MARSEGPRSDLGHALHAMFMEETPRMRHDEAVQTSPPSGFAGLRVLSLESRRGPEMAKLISNHGGVPVVAPAMREIPLESNTSALHFARVLLEGGFDMVIFLTGVGARALARVVATTYPQEQFVAALRKTRVVARGPKPLSVLREWEVPVALAVPEPNTWREVLGSLDEHAGEIPLQGKSLALQEYGEPNRELIAGLQQRGAQVTPVPVYEWGFPADTQPLRAAADALAKGEIDVVLFTSAMQVDHLLQIAEQGAQLDALRAALRRTVVASIGPVTSERLRDRQIAPDMEPSHPKMGFLVSEAAQRAASLLREKRDKATP